MLLKNEVLEAIVAGEVTLQFRKWKRPTVKTGGTLKTRVGVIAIDSVDRVTQKSLTDREARRAGFESRDALLKVLKKREGTLYRIALHYDGEDPRIALRRKKVTQEDFAELTSKLERKDAASHDGPWTIQYLELIADNEGVRAEDLARGIGMEKKPFKARVRRLKALGLTESLKVGYRLSPRGRSFLKRRSS